MVQPQSHVLDNPSFTWDLHFTHFLSKCPLPTLFFSSKISRPSFSDQSWLFLLGCSPRCLFSPYNSSFHSSATLCLPYFSARQGPYWNHGGDKAPAFRFGSQPGPTWSWARVSMESLRNLSTEVQEDGVVRLWPAISQRLTIHQFCAH